MSDEETKAIETLKEVANDDFDTLGDDISPKMAQNILNVLEKQQKEIERLNEIINSRYYHDLKCRELELEINKNWQDKIKKFIKDELPDDEIMECCGTYDVNGVLLREELEKLLGEN